MVEVVDVAVASGGMLTDLVDQVCGDVTGIIDPAALMGLSHGELVGVLAGIEALGRVMDSARILAAGEAEERAACGWDPDRTGLLAQTGCRSGRDLIGQVAGVSWREARARVQVARQVRAGTSLTGEAIASRFPVIGALMGVGLLGREQRDVIMAALRPGVQRGDPVVVAQAERCLVAAAVGGEMIAAHRRTLGHLLGQTLGVSGGGEYSGAEAVEALLDVAPRGTADGGTDAADVADAFEPPWPLRDLAQMANAWNAVVDPDGAEPSEVAALAGRGLTVGRLRDGLVPIRGSVLPEVAALLNRQLDACLNPRVDRDSASLTDNGTEEPVTGDADGRTPPQRRHDALMTILSVAAGAEGMPMLQRGLPVLVVTASAEDLAAANEASGTGAAWSRDVPGRAFLQGMHDDSSAVPIRAALHAGCAGGIQKVLLDDNGAILGSTGSPQRVFTDAQRRAILVRDGTCVIPGCQTPGVWCEVHHVQEYQDGGATDTGNGVALCWFHHRFLHLHGWQIRMRDGVPEVRAPAWMNPGGAWQQAGRSPHRHHQQARRQAAAAREGPRNGAALVNRGRDGGRQRWGRSSPART